MFIIPIPYGLWELWKRSDLVHLTFFVLAEDYHNPSEDTVLFTAQAEGEQLSRQSNCKRELHSTGIVN